MPDLQALIDLAPPGAVLPLEPGQVYTLGGILIKPVTLLSRSAGAIPGLRTWDADVQIVTQEGLQVQAPDVTFRGIGVSCVNPVRNILQVLAPRFTFEYGTALGSKTAGARRGMALNAPDWLVQHSRVDECWQVGTEGQAIAAWSGARGRIHNSYLGGASQSLMFGGADAATADLVPTNITVTRTDMVKNPLWAGLGAVVKTALELKSCVGFYYADGTLDGAGTSQGQGGYVLVLKSLNQDGHAPWSTVQNVLIERVTARHGGGGVSFVGNDGVNPSVTMGNITLRDVLFTDIDPTMYPGSHGRGFMFQGGALDVTLERVTMQARNMAAAMYMVGPPPKRLVLRNVQLPQSLYGVKIDAGPSLTTPAAIVAGLKAWAPDAIVENITIV